MEETPGRLEYEVALYREASGNNTSSDSAGNNNPSPASQTVDQAVPIGTKLQLRARISPESAWGYIKVCFSKKSNVIWKVIFIFFFPH